MDDAQQLLGTLSDGDLRRALAAKGEAALSLTVDELMNFNKPFPRTVGGDDMVRAQAGSAQRATAPKRAGPAQASATACTLRTQAYEALKVMEQKPPVTYIPVLRGGGDRTLEGLITIHDMIAAGLY